MVAGPGLALGSTVFLEAHYWGSSCWNEHGGRTSGEQPGSRGGEVGAGSQGSGDHVGSGAGMSPEFWGGRGGVSSWPCQSGGRSWEQAGPGAPGSSAESSV